jgi:hypothetical protein
MEGRLYELLTLAAQKLITIRGPIWSSYESGADVAAKVLDCRDAIAQDARSAEAMDALMQIFAPTCDWDDVVADNQLANAIFERLKAHQAKESG